MRTLIAVILLTSSGWAAGEYKSTLRGTNEIPLNLSRGVGEIIVKVNESPDSLTVTLEYEGLVGTPQQAHLHLAQEHQNGSVFTWICGGGGKPACPANGTPVTVTILPEHIMPIAAQGLVAGDLAAVLRAINAGAVYANVHTSTYPGGEIRGQLGRGKGPGRNHPHDRDDDDEDDDDEDDDDERPGRGLGRGNN